MWNYFYQLWHQAETWLRNFFGLDNQVSNKGWQRQTAPAIRANRNKATGYPAQTGHHPARLKKYTTEEVRRCLRGQERGERARLVMVEASRFATLLNANMRRHFRGRERIFDRLAYVLYQYTQGRPAYEIARSVSYFSDGDDVEEAMTFAARLIAARLNRAH